MAGRRTRRQLGGEIEELAAAVATPQLARVPGSHHVVVVGPKGGTGKTTTAAMLAMNFAATRSEIVSVLDASHQLGTLRRRLVPSVNPPTRPFQELAALALCGVTPEWSTLAPYVDVVRGLRVLRSVSSSTESPCLTPKEYQAGVAVLRWAGQVVISDIGTKANGTLIVASLECADTLVIVTAAAVEALELTIEMVSALAGEPLSYRMDPDDWSGLGDGRFASLIEGAIVVVSSLRCRSDDSEDGIGSGMATAMVDWLRVVCGGAVVVVKGDDHLAEGDLIDLEKLQLESAVSHLGVAAAVAARFPLTRTI